MMFNATFRCCLIATCLVPVVHRATAQTYRLTLKANENDVLVGMPVFLTATLTNISRTNQTHYKGMENLRVSIRNDNEDEYTLYESGVYPRKKIKRHPMTIKSGELWEFSEIILYQSMYEPYVANPRRNESGLRLKDPGRYWIMAKYPKVGGGWIESDTIAIDVSAPTSRLDRWVFDVLTCRDKESHPKQLSDKDRLECMNRYFYLLHLGHDPFTVNGGHVDYHPEFAKTLWRLLEQGAGASRYGPAIKWALRKHIDHMQARHMEQSLTKEQKHLIEDAPSFRRGAS